MFCFYVKCFLWSVVVYSQFLTALNQAVLLVNSVGDFVVRLLSVHEALVCQCAR